MSEISETQRNLNKLMNAYEAAVIGENRGRNLSGYSEKVDKYYQKRRELKEFIAELEAERHWIPVSERLPLDDGYYWTMDIFKQEQKYKFSQGKWRDQSGMLVEFSATHVTHWMPLPTPPEVRE